MAGKWRCSKKNTLDKRLKVWRRDYLAWHRRVMRLLALIEKANG
jgi:hypothetical protein